MSLTIPFTGRRDRRKHRAVDKVAELRAENIQLLTRQAAADDFFAILLDDVTTTNAAWGQEKQRRAAAEAEVDRLQQELAARDDEIEQLTRELAPHRAAKANANRVTVPPWSRPVDSPEDQATAPIDVRPLWAARDAGLLGPVLDPGYATTH
ncbi:hypothetical protein ACFWPQ_02085 [Streptomyces sp. NPDC058464]|uniref:hypothetical protein n=1 Tax=Streptomyces sp. NPDC058464 TaxID=3346511 RepID=UPI0036645DDB